MCAVLDQGYKPDLRIGAAAPAGARPTKGFLVLFGVGDVQCASVQADQLPILVPGTPRLLDCDWFNDFVVELFGRFPSQSGSGLRDARFTGHLYRNLRTKQPSHPFQQAAQDFPLRHLHKHCLGDDVIHHHMGWQVPLPDTALSTLRQCRSNCFLRKSACDHAQTDVVGDSRLFAQPCRGSRHADPPGAKRPRGARSIACLNSLSEQYWG